MIFSDSRVEAKTQPETVNITLTATKIGVPVVGATFRAENFQTVYEKIVTGNFTEQDTEKALFINLGTQYEVKDGVVTISNQLSFGKGVKNSSTNAQRIVSILFNNQHVSFLQVMNGDSLNSPLVFKFHTPGIAGRLYTDNNGQAEATVNTGLTAILDNTNQLIKLVNITKNTTNVSVDTINQDSDIKVEALNISKKTQTDNGYSIVEYGQDLKYRLTIKKEFLTAPIVLHIQPNPNVVIDHISQPYTEVSNVPNTLDAAEFGAGLGKTISIGEIVNNIIENFQENYITSYNVEIPKSTEDFHLEIESHLASNISLKRQITNIPKTATPETVSIDFSDIIPLSTQSDADKAINGNIGVEKDIKFIAENTEDGENISYQTSGIRTSGINFAMIKNQGDSLASGVTYALGKEVKNQKYLYSQSGWNKVTGSLSSLKESDYTPLKGGQIEVLDSKNSIEIPLNTNIWNFNASNQKNINKSLLEIRGLAKGTKYFLYQLTTPKNQEKNNKLNYFEINSNSIERATNQAFTINGKIPNYSAGIQEYNALPVTSGAKISYNPLFKIVLPIAFFVLLIIVATAIIIWKG